VDCWLSLLNGGYSAPDLSRLSLHPPQPLINPNHKILQAQVSDSTMGQEGELFGELFGVTVSANPLNKPLLKGTSGT
jgi:hypothetical protein